MRSAIAKGDRAYRPSLISVFSKMKINAVRSSKSKQTKVGEVLTHFHVAGPVDARELDSVSFLVDDPASQRAKRKLDASS
jgi:hypothetical protein